MITKFKLYEIGKYPNIAPSKYHIKSNEFIYNVKYIGKSKTVF